MSVYRRKGEKVWRYDFEFKNRRFTGGTGTVSRREAERIEREARARAKAELDAGGRARDALTLEWACGRYWTEVGQHHAQAETTLADLIRLQDFFGRDKSLFAIDDDAVAALVAWRRGQTVRGRRDGPRIAPATVNRSTIEPLKKVFTRARKAWRIELPREPDWKTHVLREPGERVREIRSDEEAAVDAAIPDILAPLVAFARATGLRLSECLLRKADVDLGAGRIRTIGKGGKAVSVPITAEARKILMAEMANPTEFVFTYAAKRPDKSPAAGEGRDERTRALPLTPSYVKTLWRRARRDGLPADLRFHDLRHDFATKLLRATGNIRLVQKALNHSKVETTTRYAHVLDEEILAGMEAAAKARKERA